MFFSFVRGVTNLPSDMKHRPFPSTVLAKALWLLKTNQIRQVSDNLFTIPRHSDRTPSHPDPYLIRKISHTYLCTCRGYAKRGICSHSIGVLMFLSRKRVGNTENPSFPRHSSYDVQQKTNANSNMPRKTCKEE